MKNYLMKTECRKKSLLCLR